MKSQILRSDTLAGQLQRGSGRAMRLVLAMESPDAGRVLAEALSTTGPVSQRMGAYVDGYVELILATGADLSEWLSWIAALPDGLGFNDNWTTFGILASAAALGSQQCRDFAMSYVSSGRYAAQALDACVSSNLTLPAQTWKHILPSVADEQLEWYVKCGAQPWAEISDSDSRAAALYKRRISWEKSREEGLRWEETRYLESDSASDRKDMLIRAVEIGSEDISEHLYDGLWDADHAMRRYCVLSCPLQYPGALSRIKELSENPQLGCAAEATSRLSESS